MNLAMIGLVSSLLLYSVASTQVAAPGQVNRPGEISPPNVWVQNRNPDEAIPVSIVNAGQVLRVQVTGMSGRQDDLLPTISVRQTWEYTQVKIPANQDAATTLNTAGADGWETTGLQLPTSGGTMIVLKRPR